MARFHADWLKPQEQPGRLAVRLSDATTIQEVGPTNWGALAVGRGLYLSYPWLCAVERNRTFEVHYLLARDGGGRLLGALPSYYVRDEDAYGLYDHFNLFMKPTSSAAGSHESWFPALLGGTRAGYSNEVLVDPCLEPLDRNRVVFELLRGFLDLGEQLCVRSVALLYLTPKGLREVLPVFPGRAPALFSAADTCVELKWSSFDAYLASLSHRRRYHALREMARFAAAKYRLSIGRLSEWFEVAAPLLANVQKKYGHSADVVQMRRYLQEQAEQLDDNSVMFLCHHKDRLVAFSLFYEWEGVFYARVVGFDYSAVGTHSEYFNLDYYLPIRHAIERGAHALYLGIESYEAKFRRGARPVPLWSIVGNPQEIEFDWDRFSSEWNSKLLEQWNKRYAKMGGGLAREDHWELQVHRINGLGRG